MQKFKFELKNPINDINRITGPENKNILFIESKTSTKIELKANYIIIEAPSEAYARNVCNGIKSLINISNNNPNIWIKKWDIDFLFNENKIHNNSDSTKFVINESKSNTEFIQKQEEEILNNYKNPITTTSTGKSIFPKTPGQAEYFQTLKKETLIFCTGPAGSGKTFIAIVYAIELLKQNSIKKIILSRPAIEAHESLGFLPGGLKEKIDPYLTPLYDSLFHLLGKEKTENLIKSEVIEIAPLAFMRGRTFDNAYIILDEAQNADRNQMKMFLTRLGFNSKMIVTGDITQVDIEPYYNSGLIHALEVLKDTRSATFVSLKTADIVRNPIVKDIFDAYEKWNKSRRENPDEIKHKTSQYIK